jgi:hypothetical protein
MNTNKSAFKILVVLLVGVITGCGGGGYGGGGNGGGGGGGAMPALQATIVGPGGPGSSFSAGNQAQSYTIKVTNSGTAATNGTVTVVDPPTGFTITAMTGTGWSCTVATATCTYSASVAYGQAFPPITVTGNVTAANGTAVTIQLTLSGGGAPMVNVSPAPTVNVAAVSLSLLKSHTGSFTQGQTGATYTLQVSNGANAGSTGGTVTVTEIPPSGNALTVTAMAGNNWQCTVATLTCTRSDALAGGASYDPITVTVNVSATASTPQINNASVSGGNQSGTVNSNADLTTIVNAMAAGGAVSIIEPATGFAQAVVSGVAGARTTVIVQASAAQDNGAGVNWFVDTGANVPTQGQPCTAAAVAGGNSTLGTITMHTATGVAVVYNAPASLPAAFPNNVVAICGQQPGTGGMAAGMISGAALVTIVPNNNAIPTGGGGATPAALIMQGFNNTSSGSGLPFAMIGRFTLDGVGSPTSADGSGITAGFLDVNLAQSDGSSKTYTKVPFTGGYHMDDSSHGTTKFNFTNPPWAGLGNALPNPINLAFEVTQDGGFAGAIESDPGFTGSGPLMSQDANTADFSTSVITGPYTIFLNGTGGTGTNAAHHGVVGRLDLSTGTISNTSMADDQSGSNPMQPLTGSYTLDGDGSGHGTFNITAGGSTPQVSFYVGSRPTQLVALETDPNPASANPRGILAGIVRGISGSFNNTSLTGPTPNILTLQGITPSSAANGQGHASVALGVFTGAPGPAAGSGTLSGLVDINDGGFVPSNLPLSFSGTSPGSGATFTIASNGRGTIKLPLNINGAVVTSNFVFYLFAQNIGFLVEQPDSLGANRGRTSFFAFQPTGTTPPITAGGVGTNANYVLSMRTTTSAGLNTIDQFNLSGVGNAGIYQNAANTVSGTFTVTDQTNGRGTITPATGQTFFGNGSASFFVFPIAGEIDIIGSDSSNQEPQLIGLDQ